MQIFLITTITLIVVFLLNPISKKAARKVNHERLLKVHIHHSVSGAVLLIVGVVVGSTIILSIGLGIYLAHGAEEMYFNKKRFPKAFFIFLTS
jgi:uncharacterized membrane protein